MFCNMTRYSRVLTIRYSTDMREANITIIIHRVANVQDLDGIRIEFVTGKAMGTLIREHVDLSSSISLPPSPSVSLPLSLPLPSAALILSGGMQVLECRFSVTVHLCFFTIPFFFK